MPIFSIIGNKLKQITTTNFKKEDELQELIELNLDEVFGLEFIASQFALKKFRIDTLAFNNRTKSFVILEYKKGKKLNVIEQGYAYLSLLLHNQAAFVLKYNEGGKILKIDDIDWEQSKVLFISPEFTNYQKEAVNLRNMPHELWEVSKYENDIISLKKLEPSETSEYLPKKLERSKTIQKRGAHIAIRSILITELSGNVQAGTNITLDFTNVSFWGSIFYLVWSADNFSQISSSDFKYSPTFTVADLVAGNTKIYTSPFGNFTVGNRIIVGPIPKDITGGHYYIKAFDGNVTSVAVTKKDIHVLSLIEVRLKVKDQLIEQRFKEVANFLEMAEENYALTPPHFKDTLANCRNALDDMIMILVEKIGLAPVHRFAQDVDTLVKKGIIDEDTKKVIYGVWSYLSNKGAHPYSTIDEKSIAEVDFGLEQTYSTISQLLTKYTTHLKSQE